MIFLSIFVFINYKQVHKVWSNAFFANFYVRTQIIDSRYCYNSYNKSLKKDEKKIFEGALGFEPRAYRTAADCSTTELYPQSLFVMFQSTSDSQHCWWCCQGHLHSTPHLIILMPHLATRGVGGIMVSIAAFQAVDPGSIPGRRNCFLWLTHYEGRSSNPSWLEAAPAASNENYKMQ